MPVQKKQPVDMNAGGLAFHVPPEDGLEFVFSSGRARAYPLHTHARSFTVTLVRRGAVTLFCPDGSRSYRPGEVYIDAPNQPHSPFYSDGHDLVSLCVDTGRLAESALEEISRRFLVQAAILVEQKLLSIESADLLVNGLSRCRPPEDHGLNKLIFEFGLDDCVEVAVEKLTKPPRPSASSILRYCRKHLGLTPRQYLMQNRIRAAKKLLRANHPISAAAQQAGFYDQSHLNRCFKKFVGLTPKAYLAACRFLPEAAHSYKI